MSTRLQKRHRHRLLTVIIILAVMLALCIAAVFGFKSNKSEPRGDFLPKDVTQTPGASPLSSAPPEPALRSDAVTVNLAPDSQLGTDTTVAGTATSNGTVYYRISDYRRGQIGAGELSVTAGTAQPFSFKPGFTRVYTVGDPATLDVYVLNAEGAEQTTRIPVKLK